MLALARRAPVDARLPPGQGQVVDELVAERLLAALAPHEIALALAAADEVQARRERSNRALELRVERARYDAVRAERAFHACDPENRLVARSLETRWGEKLRELKGAEAELAEHTTPAREPSREQIEALERDRRGFRYMPEERRLDPGMRVLDQLVFLRRLHDLEAGAPGLRLGDSFYHVLAFVPWTAPVASRRCSRSARPQPGRC